jgi:hypothetical protein
MACFSGKEINEVMLDGELSESFDREKPFFFLSFETKSCLLKRKEEKVRGRMCTRNKFKNHSKNNF